MAGWVAGLPGSGGRKRQNVGRLGTGESIRRRGTTAAIVIVMLGLPLLLSACGTSQTQADSGAPPKAPVPTYTPQKADLFVSSTGSDANRGTSWSQAFATIGKAASVAAPGDAVAVGPGTYSGGITTSASGTAEQRIVFFSSQPFAAKIDGSGFYTAWENDGDYVDIVGFDVSGSEFLGILNLGSFVRVVHNEVHDLTVPSCNSPNGGAGIDQANYQGQGDETIGNIVHDIQAPQPCQLVQGIYHSNKGGVIANNIVYGISAYAIQTWHYATGVRIVNNLVFGSRAGINMSGDSVLGDNYLVANNIVMDNDYGIVENGSQVGTHNRVINNLMWRNGTDFQLVHATPVGTIHADPRLVDFQLNGGGDYRPSASSPAIDAGTPEGAPSRDISGTPRPQGNGIDIGPYEMPPR